MLRAINGVLFETLREQGGPSGPRHGTSGRLQAADFVVRSLLVDQSRLPDIRRGDAVRASATSRWPPSLGIDLRHHARPCDDRVTVLTSSVKPVLRGRCCPIVR